MKVTVCQLSNDPDIFARDWERLVAHVAAERSDLVLLPEMPFSPWFACSPQYDSKIWKSTVKAIKSGDLSTIADKHYPGVLQERLPIRLEYRNEIAILTVRTFSARAYQSAKIGYPTFLKNTFQELEEKKTDHLTIDLIAKNR